MCGLVGVIGNIYSTDVNVFKQLMHVNYLRGVHATGFLNVRTPTVGNLMFKKAYNPIDVFDMKKADDALTVASSLALLGHCRQATVGAKGKHENAHPFEYGSVTMMHNGTLNSRDGLQGDRSDFPVDSSQIAYTLSELTEDSEIKTMLEELNGAFALVWHDARDETINIARNSERTLFYAVSKSGKFYYASEKEMLELVLNRNNVTVEVEPTSVPVGVWFQIPQDHKRTQEVTKVEFTPRPKRVAATTTYIGGTGTTGGNTHVVHRSAKVPKAQEAVLNQLSLNCDDTITFIAAEVGTYPVTEAFVAVKGTLSQEPWCDVIIHGVPVDAELVKQVKNNDCPYYDAKVIGVHNMSSYDKDNLTSVELVAYNPNQTAAPEVKELPAPDKEEVKK